MTRIVLSWRLRELERWLLVYDTAVAGGRDHDDAARLADTADRFGVPVSSCGLELLDRLVVARERRSLPELQGGVLG